MDRSTGNMTVKHEEEVEPTPFVGCLMAVITVIGLLWLLRLIWIA